MRYYDITKETAYEYLKRTISEHISNECLEWPFHRSKKGYGILVWPETRRCVLAHRAAFYLSNGRWPIPLGLHDCDNPPCYNPCHISQGTIQENSDHMVARGRANHPVGSMVNTALLTEQQVIEIRNRYRRGNGVHLAKEYGVHQCTISAIIVGRNWKHLKESEASKDAPLELPFS